MDDPGPEQGKVPVGSPVRFAAAVVVVGLGAALLAAALRSTLAWIWREAYGAHDVVSGFRLLAPGWRLVLPALGGLVAATIVLVTQRENVRGVGAVMEAVVLGRVRLSMPRALARSVASLAAIGSGGSIGREGPIIQLGGAFGVAVGRRCGLSPRQVRLLVAAGTGAGFTAAYNTPFAAVLFVIEIVMGVAALEALLPTIVAVALSTSLTRALVGGGPIYGARAFTLATQAELLAHAALGVAAAVAAHGFVHLLSAAERRFHASGVPQPLRAGLGGAVVGAVAVALPEVVGNGYEPLGALLDGRLALATVLLLAVAKSVTTAASVGSGSPGGVFTPTLLLGASVGLAFGRVLQLAFGPDAVGHAGGYALVGMAATSAASTHAPLMAAVLVFEVSGDYAIVVPLLLATGVATTLARRLRPVSIYGAELKRRGVAWEMTLEGRHVTDRTDP